MAKKLSAEAYGGVEGSKYTPYVTNHDGKGVVNAVVLIVGCLLAALFAMSNTYSGLLTGMTAAAGIPGAILGAGILAAFGHNHIFKTNITQGMASAGESIASGMIFVFPAVFILAAGGAGVEVTFIEGFVAGVAGALLGIGFTSIMSNYLIVSSHGEIVFPEGMAISETLVSSDAKGFGLKVMSIGAAVGALFVLVGYQFLWLFENTMTFAGEKYQWKFQAEANPILIGIGFIVGLEVAMPMLAGGFLANMAVIPLLADFASMADPTIYIWNDPSTLLSEATAGDIRNSYTKYIGSGMMMVGGFIGVIKLIPTIISSMKETFGTKVDGQAGAKDITGILVAIGMILSGIACLWFGATYDISMTFMFLIAILAIALMFIFAVVASRMTGDIGTSNLPVSGMTIASLLLVTLVFLVTGHTSPEENVVIILVASIIVTAIAASGGYAQTQKATFIIGASRPQMTKVYIAAAIVGVVVSVATMFLLKDGIVSGAFPAAQANLMASLTQGILTGTLPWAMIFTGGFMAIVLWLLKLPIMTFAIGFYLPFATVTAVTLGAILKFFVDNKKYKSEEEKVARGEKAVLYASGLIAGGSLCGLVAIIIQSVVATNATFVDKAAAAEGMPAFAIEAYPNAIPFLLFVAICSISYFYVVKGKTALDA